MARAKTDVPSIRSLPLERDEFEHKLPTWAGFRYYAKWPDAEPPSQDGTVNVNWEDDSEDEPTPAQHIAFDFLKRNEAAITNGILRRVLAEYPALKREYDEAVAGDPSSLVLLEITDVDGLREVIGPPSLYILEGERDGIGYLGFMFQCAWDKEHGLGVVTHRGDVVDLGEKHTAFTSP